jgi:UbiD family decarboxylase
MKAKAPKSAPTPAAGAHVSGQSLRRYLEVLEGEGKLQRIGKTVDVDENISALSYQAYVQRGKGCLFSDIKGFPGWEVASQLVMDRDMWALALGVPETEVVSTLAGRLAETIAPQMVAEGPVQEVVETGKDVDLMKLPAMWTSDNDPGRYIASGMCIIKDPETGIRNMSVHRAQILGRDSTGYFMLPRQAMRIHQMHQKLGRPMEAAMVIGGHPLIMFAAGFVAPFGTDELSVAGALLRHPVRLVKCKTIDVEVPADAEIVLEGEILPGEEAPEGPFGEVTGTYSKRGTAPVFRVKAITRRRNPVFYAMSCGMAPSDAHSITCAVVEAKLWDHLKGVDGGLLEVRDIRSPGGMSPLVVAVRLKPRYAGQSRTALMAAAASPYLHPKFLIAVDEDVDAGDSWAILRALAGRLDPVRGLTRIDRTRVFTLDNGSPLEPGQSPMHRTGSKVLFDATLPADTPAAERARHAWQAPAEARGRTWWARALDLPEAGFVFALRDRLDARIKPAVAPAAALPPVPADTLYPTARQALTGVLVLDEELCLVRAFRDGAHLALALDTPRLAALLATRRKARLLLGVSPATLLAAACGTLGLPADWSLAGGLAKAAAVRDQALAMLEGEVDPAGTGKLGSVPGLTGFAGVALDSVRFKVLAGRGDAGAALEVPDLNGLLCVANEALTARHLRNIEGGLDLRDVHCPPGAAGLMCVLQIAPRVAGQAKTALVAALSGPCTLSRWALAIDPDVSATDAAELIWVMASRTHAIHDVTAIDAASCLPSDPCAQPVAPGAAIAPKWICDATIPLGMTGGEGAESFSRATPKNNATVKLADFLP